MSCTNHSGFKVQITRKHRPVLNLCIQNSLSDPFVPLLRFQLIEWNSYETRQTPLFYFFVGGLDGAQHLIAFLSSGSC